VSIPGYRRLESSEMLKGYRLSPMYEIWVSIALLGLWSCVGVIYSNSRKASRQLDEMVLLLKQIAAKR
jgi:hypothetical protein